MKSKAEVYRSNMSNIVRQALYKKFPGLKKSQVSELCRSVSLRIVKWHKDEETRNADGT